MAPKDAQVLIPRMCDYVTLHGRGDSADGMKALRWEVIILNDLNGPSVATEGEEEAGESYSGWCDVKRTQLAIAGFEDGMGTRANACGQLLEAGKGKKMDSLL